MSEDELPNLTFIEIDALEVWDYKGVRCVIKAGFCALNGYVRLPTKMRGWWKDDNEAGDVLSTHGWITYGPDDDGFVGFDTTHCNDYWAADDLIGIVSDEGMFTASMLARQNSGDEYARRWTRARLRSEVEELAEQIAALTGELDLMMDGLEDVKRKSNEGD